MEKKQVLHLNQLSEQNTCQLCWSAHEYKKNPLRTPVILAANLVAFKSHNQRLIITRKDPFSSFFFHIFQRHLWVSIALVAWTLLQLPMR